MVPSFFLQRAFFSYFVTAEGEEEETEEEEQPDEVGDEPVIKSKADLYKVYGGKGPNSMVLKFLEERILQTHALIIVWLTSPIENEYNMDLQAMQAGPESQGEWSAKRASGQWLDTAKGMIDILQSPDFWRRLRVFSFDEPAPLDSEDAHILFQWDVTKLAVDFCFECVSRYVWAHLPTIYSIPQGWAVYLLKDGGERRQAVQRLKGIIQAVQAAEKKWKTLEEENDKKSKEFQTLFRDIGWVHYQFSRELMALAIQSDFQSDDLTCRRIAARLFRATSTTKHVLEDCFAHLQRALASSASNKKMADFTKWFYATTSRTAKIGGVETILPDIEDWEKGSYDWFKFSKGLAASFNTDLSPLPEPGDDPADILRTSPAQMLKKRTWKAAGPASNQRGAAAVAYLEHDLNEDFHNLSNVWCGFLPHTCATQRMHFNWLRCTCVSN